MEKPRTPSGASAGANKPQKADWRRPAPSAGPSQRGTPGWRSPVGDDIEAAETWHGYKIAAGLLVALGLIGVLIWWLWPRPYRTPLLVMAVTEYELPVADLPTGQTRFSRLAVPPNAWADEDAERFKQLDAEQIVNYARIAYSANATGASGVEAFEGLRNAIAEVSGKHHPTVVVYLSVHGVVNASGEPCVLLPDRRETGDPARADAARAADAGFLPLKDLLAYLFDDKNRSLPRNKLVILDANRLSAAWRLGMLYNGLADGLQSVVDDLKTQVPGLALLNSTSPGQTAWASPEVLKQSVLAHYVRLALEGAAGDERFGGSESEDISLGELHRFVRRNVRVAVKNAYADVQEPLLVLQGGSQPEDEIPVVRRKRFAPSASASAAESTARPDELVQRWKQHAGLHATQPWRTRPVQWARYQRGLVRLEQWSQAGKAYQPAYESLAGEMKSLEKVLKQPLPLGEQTQCSFPLAMLGRSPQALATWRAQRFSASPATPKPGEKAADLDAAANLWTGYIASQGAGQGPQLSKSDVQGVYAPAAAAWGNADPVEWRFLGMLLRHLDEPLWSGRADAIRLAMSARDQAEEAALPADLRAHYAVRPLVDKADRDRRRAEDLLFVGQESELAQYEKIARTLASLDRKQGAYAEAIGEGRSLSEAFALRDRALAEAPFYAQWLWMRGESEPADGRSEKSPAASGVAPAAPAALAALADVQSLVGKTDELAAALDQAIDRAMQRSGDAAEWRKASQTVGPPAAEVDGLLRRLEKGWNSDCDRLTSKDAPDARTLRQIVAVLSLPLATGATRQRLWDRYDEILPQIAPRAFEIVAAEPRASDAESKTPPKDARRDELLRRAAADGRPLLQALVTPQRRPSPADSAESTERQVMKAGGEIRAQLAGLVPEVHAALDKALREPQLAAMRAAAAKVDLVARRTAALWPALPIHVPGDVQSAREEPAEILAALDSQSLLVWHARRALDDFYGPRQAPYFDLAAGRFLDAAREHANRLVALKLVADPPLAHQYDALQAVRTRLLEASKAGVEAIAEVMAVGKPEKVVPGKPSLVAEGDVTAKWQKAPPGIAAVYLLDPAGRTLPLSLAATNGPLRRLAFAAETASTQPAPWRGKFPVGELDNAAVLQAVALFRGHEWARPFDLGRGMEIAFEPQPPKPARVQVRGKAMQEACPVVFVIDCSWSMTEKVLVPKEKKPGDVGDPGMEERPRFDVARDSLKSILDSLGENLPDYRIGLIAYGHRVGYVGSEVHVWDKTLNKAVPKPANSPLPPPQEDVQTLQLPEVLNADGMKRLKGFVDGLQPMGETPLYLAINTAIDELERIPASGREGTRPRRIFVITDGVDQVFKPNGATAEKIAARLRANKDIRLDVVGFALSDWELLVECAGTFPGHAEALGAALNKQSTEIGRLLREYRDLEADARKNRVAPEDSQPLKAKRAEIDAAIERTSDEKIGAAPLSQRLAERFWGFRAQRGEVEGIAQGFYPAQNKTEVMQALERSRLLLRATVEVVRKADRRALAPVSKLNDLIELAEIRARDQRAPCEVRVQRPDGTLTAELTLEGGRLALLRISDDGSRLEHVDDTGEDTGRKPWRPAQVDGRESASYLLAPHIRETKQRGQQSSQQSGELFRVSVWNKDPARFTPRPREAWAEIIPVDAAARPYLFCDMEFDDDKSVPTLSFFAPGWPAGRDAEIRVWLQLETSAAAAVVQAVPPRPGVSQTVEAGSPKVKFDVRWERGAAGMDCRVIVVGRSESDAQDAAKEKPAGQGNLSSQGPAPFMVKVQMDNPPVKITREYHYLTQGKSAAAGSVRHTFYYKPSQETDLPGYKIHFTPQSAILAGAVSNKEPFTVAPTR